MEVSFHGQYDQGLFFKSVMLANQPPKSLRFVRTFMSVFIVTAVVVLASRLAETGDIFKTAKHAKNAKKTFLKTSRSLRSSR